MARVRLGSIVTDIRGKVGGSVYQRSRSGLSLRSNTVPVNKRTPLQQQRRITTAQLQREWQSLTNAQQNAWNQWPQYQNLTEKNNPQVYQTGHNAFFMVNYYRTLANREIIRDPIFTPFSSPTGTIHIYLHFNELRVMLLDGATETETDLHLYLSAPQTSNKKPTPNTNRYISGPVVFPLTYDITDDYTKSFGRLPQAGESLSCRFFYQQIDNGTFSTEFYQILEVG